MNRRQYYILRASFGVFRIFSSVFFFCVKFSRDFPFAAVYGSRTPEDGTK